MNVLEILFLSDLILHLILFNVGIYMTFFAS